jgi:Ca2+-binding RTX toxin-like protein
MGVPRWKDCLRRWFTPARPARGRASRFRPQVECLETRWVPVAIPYGNSFNVTAVEDTIADFDLRAFLGGGVDFNSRLAFGVTRAWSGSATLLADGYTVRFTPNANHQGAAGFEFTVQQPLTLYSVNPATDELAAIDPVTGAVTMIGVTGYELRGGDLASFEGHVHALTDVDSNPTNSGPWQVVRIDPTSGDGRWSTSIQYSGAAPPVVQGITAHQGKLVVGFDAADQTASAVGDVGYPSLSNVRFFNANGDVDIGALEADGELLYSVERVEPAPGVTDWAFYTLGRATGQRQYIGSLNLPGANIDDLAITADGCYVLDKGRRELHLLQLTPSSLVLVRSVALPTPAANLRGLTALSGMAPGGTMNIFVNPVNDVPVASSASADLGGEVYIDVDLSTLVGDVEAPGSLIEFVVGNAANGTVALLPDGHTARFTRDVGYTGPASFTYQALDWGTRIAQSGFNDAAGINGNGTANAPFRLNAPLQNQGSGESGWGGSWQGAGVATVVVGQRQEGDGALFLSSNSGAQRTLTFSGTNQFVFDQWLRLEAGAGAFTARLQRSNQAGSPSGAAVQWQVAPGGTFAVMDGNGDSAADLVPEDTGIAVALDTWTRVTVVVDRNARTWEFYVNGVKYDAPDPLGYWGNLSSPDQIAYTSERSSGVWIDGIRVLAGQQVSPLSSNEATVSLTVGPLSPVNEPPTAQAVTLTLPDHGAVAVTLSGADEETPAANLRYTIASLPTRGALLANGVAVRVGDSFVGSPGNLTYRLSLAVGAVTDSFTYFVTDGGDPDGTPANVQSSGPATVTLRSPAWSGNTVRVGGTAGDDAIVLGTTADGTRLRVTVDGVVVSDSLPLASVSEVRVFGREGHDTLQITGLETRVNFDGGAGTDVLTVDGTAGADGFQLLSAGVQLRGLSAAGAGVESLVLRGLEGPDTLTGHNTLNTWTVTGTDAGDVNGRVSFSGMENLSGGSLADTFTFQAGRLTGSVLGGVGDDAFVLAGGTVGGALDGGDHRDTVDYSAFTTAVTVNLRTNLATDVGQLFNVEGLVGGAANSDRLIAADTANAWHLATLNQGAVNDLIFADVEFLTGGTAEDVFTFADGAGVTGRLDGGAGVDTLDYAAYTAGVTVNLATGAATGTGALPAGGAFGFENVTGGSGNDVLTGTSAANRLSGGAGNDKLNGGGGTDRLVETADVNFTLRDTSLSGLGNDVLSGIETATLTGGAGDNVLNAAAFTLGGVTLDGGAGNDTLTGGSKADTLTGGTGDDVLKGGAGADRVVETADVHFVLTNTRLTGNGTDTLNAVEAATLIGGAGDNVINAVAFTGVSILDGGAGNDTLTGGAGANTLLGGDGDDTLTGGGGNDNLQGGADHDTLVEAGNVSFTLGDVKLTGLGTDTLGGLEHAQLTGGAAANVFALNGWTGTAVIDGAGGSTDRVAVTQDADFTLAPGLIARSSAGAVTFGNSELVTLTGGAGHNRFTVSDWFAAATLVGGGGIDTVGSGNDANFTLINTRLTRSTGGSFTLAAIEQAHLTGGAGNNSINAGAFTLGNVILDGAGGNDVLTGGSRDDLILGGTGNDTLNGGGGRDFLLGGTDLDALNGGAGEDIVAHGTTTYEVFDTAFASVLAEWRRTDQTYAQRVAHLRTGGGLNGANLLNSATMLDDAFINSLTGGLNLDWFFAKQPGDTLTDRVNPAEQVN